MKKKLFVILITIICAIACAFAITACFGDGGNGGDITPPDNVNSDVQGGDPSCKHVFDWQPVVKPEQNKEGNYKGTCVRCKAERTIRLPALSDSKYKKVATEATCGKSGTTIYTIFVDGAEFKVNVNVPATGNHNYVNGKCSLCGDLHVHAYVIAKYDKSGHWTECACGQKSQLTAHTYSDYKNDALNHWHECTGCKTVDTAKHSFDKIDVIEQASCIKEGSQTLTCSVCKVQKTEKVDKLKHNFGAWQSSANGMHVHTCMTEGCGQQESELHTYNAGTETKAATCITTGSMLYECTGCKTIKTEVTPKTAHSYGSWLTTGLKSHTHSCTFPKCTAKETADHTLNAYGVCTVCAYVRGVIIDGLRYKIVRQTSSTAGAKSYASLLGFAAAPTQELSIPTNINHNGTLYPVTEISDDAFAECTALKHLSYGITLKKIGARAFQSAGLETVSTPNAQLYDVPNELGSVEEIGEMAFANCKFTSILVPAWLKTIGKGVFTNNGLLELVEIHSQYVGEEMFKDCVKIKNITIGYEVETIKTGSFMGCAYIVKVTLYSSDPLRYPMRLSKIEKWAFSRCSDGSEPFFSHTNEYWWEGTVKKETDWLI